MLRPALALAGAAVLTLVGATGAVAAAGEEIALISIDVDEVAVPISEQIAVTSEAGLTSEVVTTSEDGTTGSVRPWVLAGAGALGVAGVGAGVALRRRA